MGKTLLHRNVLTSQDDVRCIESCIIIIIIIIIISSSSSSSNRIRWHQHPSLIRILSQFIPAVTLTTYSLTFILMQSSYPLNSLSSYLDQRRLHTKILQASRALLIFFQNYYYYYYYYYYSHK